MISAVKLTIIIRFSRSSYDLVYYYILRSQQHAWFLSDNEMTTWFLRQLRFFSINQNDIILLKVPIR